MSTLQEISTCALANRQYHNEQIKFRVALLREAIRLAESNVFYKNLVAPKKFAVSKAITSRLSKEWIGELAVLKCNECVACLTRERKQSSVGLKDKKTVRIVETKNIKKFIRSLLRKDLASEFLHGRQYLMTMAIGQETKVTYNRLNDIFGSDMAVINEMMRVYGLLANTFFFKEERVSRNKTVSGNQSLLGYFTDGQSHLKVYPDVDFNILSLNG